MDNSKYTEINNALALEFGEKIVEIRPLIAPGKDWEYCIWFSEDVSSPETIAKAKDIISEFETSYWYDNEMFHSDD